MQEYSLNIFSARKLSVVKQTIICLLFICLLASICFLLRNYLDYKVVALIFLVAVSVVAIIFEIIPVLVAAFASSLLLNFLFLKPLYTFHISSSEDILMLLMYFILAFVNAVFTFNIRELDKKTQLKKEKENSLLLYNTLINSLSHELRTPLATIIGAIDTLAENSNTISEKNKNELFSQIEIASTRLNNQVENLLNMSRLESGMLKLNKQWHDINELLHIAIQKLDFSKKKLFFQSNENMPLCKIDSMLFEQIISNLLSNAITYTPIFTEIHINSTIANDNLMLEIIDFGNGIDEAYLPHIFEKFYRLPNSKAGGTGLGLSIVKGFIEAQNGSIKAIKNEPHGLKFVILIPVETSYIKNLKNE